MSLIVQACEPKEISVRVPEMSGWQNSEPYPNRNIQVTKIQVPHNFGSGFRLHNNPFILKSLFVLCLIILLYP